MKRIGPVKAEDLSENTANDATIQKDAEESVETSEVETEAMAEVWIKQVRLPGHSDLSQIKFAQSL
jgi:hypothetical protein